MSFSLDDIWDEPVVQSPLRTPAIAIDIDEQDALVRPSPAKRRRTTLFLSSDSEDDSQPKPSKPISIRQPPRTPQKRADIEALFDGLDDDDAFQDLGPSLNIDQLRKQAAANLPSLTPHEILPSSSPPRDFGGDDGDARDGGAGARGKDKDKDGDGLHKRKVVVKLDDARLLSPDGFPALVKQAKHFKPRGKGHELSDLNRLMQIYQFWSHKMYPKGYFSANVQRVEKLCHSKRMISALGVWRDEAKGLINGVKPEELNSEGEDHSDSESDKEGAVPAPPAREQSPLPPSSPPRPSSSASIREEDDFDIDAVIREEEERLAAAATASASHTVVPASIQTKPAVLIPVTQPAGDEDEAMWDEFGFDDDTLMSATQQPPAPPAPAHPPVPMTVDEDEDMWDIVRELEEEQSRQAQTRAQATEASTDGNGGPSASSAPSITAAGSGQAEGSEKERTQATNDEGWDEMYL